MLSFLQISLPFFVLLLDFIYFWLHQKYLFIYIIFIYLFFAAVLRLSLAAATGGYSLWCEGFSPRRLLIAEHWL